MSKSERCSLAIEIEVQHNAHLTRYDTWRDLRDRGLIHRNEEQPFFTPTKMQLVKKYYRTHFPDWADEFGDHFEEVTTITHKDLKKWLDLAKRLPGTEGDEDNDVEVNYEYTDSSNDESYEPNAFEGNIEFA